MKLIAKASRRLKAPANDAFGKKEKVVKPSTVETAIAAGTFNTLLAAVKAAGLVDTLNNGIFTILAPTDEAFAALPEGALDGLLADKAQLTKVLKFHVLSGYANANVVKASKDKSLPTLLEGKGPTIKVSKEDEISIDSAKVVTPNIICGNGLIHVISAVLMPPADAPVEPAA